ncbi:hypothetical protein CDAR_423161 [Caerostris darwini]|uniref:Uncharacterized protein n=1 Tax=Caerostris darwini TaxID=1538125 RepID=A0AAV4UR83_9ARAC|nr:hypothetical protein CDAR_423161 [Caerostris darwini]
MRLFNPEEMFFPSRGPRAEGALPKGAHPAQQHPAAQSRKRFVSRSFFLNRFQKVTEAHRKRAPISDKARQGQPFHSINTLTTFGRRRGWTSNRLPLRNRLRRLD